MLLYNLICSVKNVRSRSNYTSKSDLGNEIKSATPRKISVKQIEFTETAKSIILGSENASKVKRFVAKKKRNHKACGLPGTHTINPGNG